MEIDQEKSAYNIIPKLSVLDVFETLSLMEERDRFSALQNLVANYTQDLEGQKIPASDITELEVKEYIAGVKEKDSHIASLMQKSGASNEIESFYLALEHAFDLTDVQRATISKIKTMNLNIEEKTKDLFNSITDSMRRAQKELEDVLKETLMYAKKSIKYSWEDAEKCGFEWAKYGWTIIWDAPSGLFFTYPTSLENADKLAFKYIGDDFVDKLISDISKFRDDMEDIHSANTCYQIRQYKACCLMLLTLIEKVLIKSKSNNRRKVGIGAIKSFENLTIKSDKKYQEIRLLAAINTLSYLNIMFSNADDFLVQPEGINRNFLAHGMYENEVTKNDCIKLFLGLYNVVRFYDRFIERGDPIV